MVQSKILLSFFFVTAKQVTSSQRSIHDAVKDGNVQILEAMVKSGASINELDMTKDHFTALHWACHVGSLEVMYSLLFNIFFYFLTVVPGKNRTPRVDVNHFFQGGRRYSNSTDLRGVLVKRPKKSGMGDVYALSLIRG